MKTYKYIALAALALGFTACSQDEDFTPQQEDIVQIATANIATEVQTRVNTLDDGTQWENNDQILLVNNSRTTNKNSGTYTYDGTTWKLTSGIVLYASSGTNDFTAYYPAESEEDYKFPTDQSTEAGIKSADRMVATTSGVAKGDAVALSFERRNAMVTITPSFNTEFGDDAAISGLQIDGITSYHPASAADYKAIIAPCTGFEVTVKVKVGETEQTLTAASTTVIESGNHYTFSLTVGKNVVNITNVSVTKWTEQPIGGVETDEIVEVATLEDFEAAIAKGGTVLLASNITLDGSFPELKNVTINLNGYTLTSNHIDGVYVDAGVLTLTGEGTVNGDIWAVYDGTVNLQGGDVGGSFYVDYGGTANIFGGNVKTMNCQDGASTITGGTVNTLNANPGSTVIISGGTVDVIWTMDDSAVAISGGHVNKEYFGEGTIIISGGTFGFDPTEYVDIETYTVTKADNIWTVAPSNN